MINLQFANPTFDSFENFRGAVHAHTANPERQRDNVERYLTDLAGLLCPSPTADDYFKDQLLNELANKNSRLLEALFVLVQELEDIAYHPDPRG